MTAPRSILPGATYLVTRRCASRHFLLRPDRKTNDIFLFILALAARRYDIRVHAYCVMSNHYHLVVTDPHARLPAFQQYLDGLAARALNAHRGRWEAFWSPASYSAVTLVTPSDVVAKVAYVLANPVSAGLVSRGRLWPGLWSEPGRLGGDALRARRPDGFFDPSGYLPVEVELQLQPPPGFESAVAFRCALESALEQLEAAARSQHRGFLGAVRVLRQKPTGRPKEIERRRGLSPRVAAADKWRRVEVLGRLRDFLSRYRSALEAWRDGARSVAFPPGTYLMRVAHGAVCEPNTA